MLEEIAPEIPVLLDLAKRKMLMFERIHSGISSGEVWIALDRTDRVAGFLLAKPDELERFWHDNQALNLAYGGVRTSHRGQGIFAALVARMKSKGVPLTAKVQGFFDSSKDEDNLRWQP